MFQTTKFFFFITINFFILSIPINNKTVFKHLHKYTSPYTQIVFNFVKEKTNQGIIKGKKLIGNTFPDQIDSIKTSLSSTKIYNHDSKDTSDTYTEEEKALLERILKSN